MTTTAFTRHRRPVPDCPARGEIAVAAPPSVSRPGAGGVARLVPIVTAAVSLVATVVLVMTGSMRHNPALLMFPAMMVVSAIASAGSAGWGRRGADLDGDRSRYLAYLTDTSVEAAGMAAAVHDWHQINNPAPAQLWTVVGGLGMWTRHGDDADFCRTRVGIGDGPSPARLVPPDGSYDGGEDPVTAAALQRVLGHHDRPVPVPVTVALAGATVVTVSGPGGRARSLARAMICQVVVAHSPADVRVTAVVDGRHARDWDWLKWLPHQRYQAPMPPRRIIVVVDGGPVPAPDPATTVLCVAESGGEIHVRHGAEELVPTGADQLTPEAAVALARRLARYRPAEDPAAGERDWLWRIGVRDPFQIDAATVWQRAAGVGLRVPIGIAVDGGSVDLDIREAASGGMGPHGLCVGATGSGKSELLRTVALGMIARHSPETLNLVLVDFKGGATFLGLERTRHVVAVITNLEDEAHLVERMRDALGGEIDRRQRLLRSAGNLDGVAAYHRARRTEPDLPPLPVLFVIVDEFSELLSRHPDFAEMFVAIGRLGRSLGIHLLLASQRLDEGRLRGLDSHLSYRICLKTLSEAESRAVLGVPDAYQLPGRPGGAYLKVAEGPPVRFQADRVSVALPADPRRAVADPAPRVFTLDALPTACDTGTTVFEAVVGAVAGRGPMPHRVWLPPLTESPRVTDLLADIPTDHLRVPIALVDNAFRHTREPMTVELAGPGGHVAVIGAPRSGKTTVVQTLVSALAATHDPRRVQVYCLDFGGGGLAALVDLPHVGTVAGPSRPELGDRTLAEMLAILRRRETAGHDELGDVFLVVDGWGAARREHDQLEDTVTALAATGLAHGVHVVLTATRWAEVRPGLRDQIGTRIELKLGDPADSEIDRAAARRVPAAQPGHGLSPAGLPIQMALPASTFRSADDGWCAPGIRLLPARIDRLALACTTAPGCLLGIDEDHRAVRIDLEAAHLLIFGEPGCGKTAALRLLCHEIARSTPEWRLVVVDPRRTLAGFGGTGPAGLPALIGELRARVANGAAGQPVCLVVDDYDLSAPAVAPLADILPHDRDIGLHLVVARRSGGAARALYDPVLSALRDSGATGLQLSAAPDDGPLLPGVRTRPLPPGRGVLVTRQQGARTVQVAWAQPR